MQGRHRNSSNDGRGYNSSSNYRSFNRSGSVSGSFNRKQYLPPPPRRKEEILMEAGRLAAEYLVYKGLLPPNSIPPKSSSSKFHNFKAQDRESLVPVPDDRNLASLNRNAGHGRKRYTDDYDDDDDQMRPRNHFRGKRERRMDPYSYSNSRDYGSDWGRENGRWMERGRNRGYNNDDDMEEEDDFAQAAYHSRDRRSGFNHFPSRSEVTGESGSDNHDVAEDTGSKVSSSSTKKEVQSDADGDLNKSMTDNIKATISETGDEVKSDNASRDSKKESQGEEEGESGAHAHAREAGEGDNEDRGNLLVKLCDFARVPTKLRSSLTQRSPGRDEGIPTEASNTIAGSPVGEPKVTSGEDIAVGSLIDSPTTQTDTKGKLPEDVVSLSSVQHVVRSVDQILEACQTPPDPESSKSKSMEEDEEEEEEVLCKREGMKRQRDSSLDDEFSRMQNLRLKLSNPVVEKVAVDVQMVMPTTVIESLVMGEELVAQVEVDQEKQGHDDCFPKSDPELDVKLEEEQQLLPTSFKICDLNLMGAPEITEIPDDPAPDTIQSSTSNLETVKALSMDFGLSIGNSNNEVHEYNQLSRDDKVVQVIDLDVDSPICGDSCDPLKPKDETMYPNLDSFLNQTEHADLPGIQDGYSLEISEFLGSDISHCPSVPSDLNNLDSGMGLHDTEGVPNDDDSIYVSLGEIPIGFMEVWDQPPQGYGKFF